MTLPPTLVIALALLVVIVLRRFLPLVAASLGMLLAIGVGVWALAFYQENVVMGGRTLLPRQIFVGLAAVLLVLESTNLWLAWRRKKSRKSPQ
jgi:hypothetical protein